jgi:hypothetical protein
MQKKSKKKHYFVYIQMLNTTLLEQFQHLIEKS